MSDHRSLVTEANLRWIHARPTLRKAQLYWSGFLGGALASGDVETEEADAVSCEAHRSALLRKARSRRRW